MELQQSKIIPKLVKKSLCYKMIIPQKVEAKIRYACKLIPDVEWSGILFYTHTGNFEDRSLIIKCEDIYIMDIGSSGYTEFDMSPEVVSYMTENPELLDYQLSLIHSHGQMATFFSSTDTDTLLKEGLDRNHFVSLIVNNAGKYTAAITRKISVNRTLNEDISYKSFNDEEIKKSESTVESVEEVQYFMLDIHIENSNEEQSIEQRLNEIKNKKILDTPSNTLFNIPNRPLTLYNNTYSNDMRNKKEEFKTPSLFDKYDGYNNYEDYNTTKINKNEELDLDSIIDKSSIKSLLYQLITGSIIISNESKIDLNKWVKGMDSLFDKRFKDTDDDLSNFTSWAESYIDYICCGELCSTLPLDIDIDDLSSTIATQLIKELEKLSPNNKYIKKFIKILKRYTL